MGYRRNSDKVLHDKAKWKQWRKENNDVIAASGLPELVVADADHWYDFLDHGYLDHHEDALHFSVQQLTVKQKTFLLQLVGIEGGGYDMILGRTLIQDLIRAVRERFKE